MSSTTRSRKTAIACLLVLAVLGLHGCTSQPESRRESVAPGKLFKGSYVDVRAPSSDGWELLQSSDTGLAFAKDGEHVDESFVAQVGTFKLQPTATPAEFEALIRASVQRDSDSNRFDVQQASYKYAASRGYPCVRYRAVVRDKAPPKARYPLLLETDALYCRHPVQPETGFAATYSHRGPTLYGPLESEAESFIAGVQVPGR